eukprot:TRINITY_DN988_c0_g2_i1.p2 TRINITY_DN988_c0_g2~~TRINITY_DN988_c0_g2_i1.p2  ORF type:complete len:162 (-),score=54.78 TRINITY_DN988_c0_g2_i1:43-528(-)
MPMPTPVQITTIRLDPLCEPQEALQKWLELSARQLDALCERQGILTPESEEMAAAAVKEAQLLATDAVPYDPRLLLELEPRQMSLRAPSRAMLKAIAKRRRLGGLPAGPASLPYEDDTDNPFLAQDIGEAKAPQAGWDDAENPFAMGDDATAQDDGDNPFV